MSALPAERSPIPAHQLKADAPKGPLVKYPRGRDILPVVIPQRPQETGTGSVIRNGINGLTPTEIAAITADVKRSLVLRGRPGERERIDDAVSSAWIRLLQQEPGVVRNPGSWLYTVARNEFIKLTTSALREAPTDFGNNPGLISMKQEPEASLIETAASAKDMLDSVRGTLLTLSPGSRSVLYAAFLGFNTSETAALLDMPKSSVGPTLQRVRDRFGRKYAATTGEPPPERLSRKRRSEEDYGDFGLLRDLQRAAGEIHGDEITVYELPRHNNESAIDAWLRSHRLSRDKMGIAREIFFEQLDVFLGGPESSEEFDTRFFSVNSGTVVSPSETIPLAGLPEVITVKNENERKSNEFFATVLRFPFKRAVQAVRLAEAKSPEQFAHTAAVDVQVVENIARGGHPTPGNLKRLLTSSETAKRDASGKIVQLILLKNENVDAMSLSQLHRASGPELVRYLRTANGATRGDVSVSLHKGVSTIQDYESGRKSMNEKFVNDYIVWLGLAPDSALAKMIRQKTYRPDEIITVKDFEEVLHGQYLFVKHGYQTETDEAFEQRVSQKGEFKHLLEKTRGEMDITQERLASEAGLSTELVEKVIWRNSIPRDYNIVRMGNVMGMTINDEAMWQLIITADMERDARDKRFAKRRNTA